MPARGVLVAAVLALVALGAGCGGRSSGATGASDAPGAAPPSTGLDAPGTTPTTRAALAGGTDAVLVVGDSLTVGAAEMGGLHTLLRSVGFESVEVIAEEGRDTAWGLAQIEALDVVAPIVVVELGTNRSANPAGFAEVVAAVVDALRARGAVRVAWVTPVFATDDRYQEKIDVLHAAGGVDVVADWASVVHADPTLISDDGLHPTEAGYGSLAEFLVDTAGDLAER